MTPVYKSEKSNESNYWNWNGFKIFWNVKGKENRQPLIMLHGFGASSKHWRNNSKYFAKKGYSVYSIDLIGFGKSAQPGIREIGKLDNGVWCNQVNDFIHQVIRPKNSNKIILIGNSLGSLVALTCAVYLKNEILTVIASPLPDPLIIKKESKFISIFEKFKIKFVKIFFRICPLEFILFLINKLGIIKIGLNSAYCKKDHIDQELINIIRMPVLRKTAARSLRAMCIGMSTRRYQLKASYLLEQLSHSQKKIPFLLLWGEKDNFVPLFFGKKIANHHRWLELKVIPNSGHCVHDEDPSLFNKISHEWIRDLKTI